YASEMMNWGFKTFGVPLGKGSIDLKAIVDILINESKLDRIMLELPVEKEATEAATLKKEDDCVAESVAYGRNILLKDYNYLLFYLPPREHRFPKDTRPGICRSGYFFSVARKSKKPCRITSARLFVGGSGWIRTTEAKMQQIYSLPPLAAREHSHISVIQLRLIAECLIIIPSVSG